MGRPRHVRLKALHSMTSVAARAEAGALKSAVYVPCSAPLRPPLGNLRRWRRSSAESSRGLRPPPLPPPPLPPPPPAPAPADEEAVEMTETVTEEAPPAEAEPPAAPESVKVVDPVEEEAAQMECGKFFC